MIEWRDIPGAAQYEVSSDGRVRAKPRELKPWTMREGHQQVVINGKSVYVHRLVALAFLANKDVKRIVNHKNGNPKDNRVDNLEWATHSENNLHAYRINGRIAPATTPVMAISKDGEVAYHFKSIKEAAKHIGLSSPAVASAVRRKGTSGGFRWIKA